MDDNHLCIHQYEEQEQQQQLLSTPLKTLPYVWEPEKDDELQHSSNIITDSSPGSPPTKIVRHNEHNLGQPHARSVTHVYSNRRRHNSDIRLQQPLSDDEEDSDNDNEVINKKQIIKRRPPWFSADADRQHWTTTESSSNVPSLNLKPLHFPVCGETELTSLQLPTTEADDVVMQDDCVFTPRPSSRNASNLDSPLTPAAPLRSRTTYSLASSIARSDASAVATALKIGQDDFTHETELFVEWIEHSLVTKEDTGTEMQFSKCTKSWVAPILFATRVASPKVVSLLLAAGASPYTKNHLGQNALACLCSQPRFTPSRILQSTDDTSIYYRSTAAACLSVSAGNNRNSSCGSTAPFSIFPVAKSHEILSEEDNSPRDSGKDSCVLDDLAAVSPPDISWIDAVEFHEANRLYWAETLSGLRIAEMRVIAELLIFYGVDMFERDSLGFSAVDYADMFKHAEISELMNAVVKRKIRREHRVRSSKGSTRMKESVNAAEERMMNPAMILKDKDVSACDPSSSCSGGYATPRKAPRMHAVPTSFLPACQTPTGNPSIMSPSAASSVGSFDDCASSLATCDTMRGKRKCSSSRVNAAGGSQQLYAAEPNSMKMLVSSPSTVHHCSGKNVSSKLTLVECTSNDSTVEGMFDSTAYISFRSQSTVK